ncbi:MAG: glycosyltransferase [Gammaproteobacteria bacterium]|nr:MAG: glycosyltransferase [Gammaproteobacteria bacterium]
MAKLSILLPFRNAQDTLHQALNSVLQQTFVHFDLIAINDNSHDESVEIIESFNDVRIRLLHNPGNGLVDALNFGLDHAKSGWIGRMDADDIMHTSKLEKQWAYLQDNSAVDILACGSRLFPEHAITDGFAEYMRWQNNINTHTDFMNQMYVEMPLTNPTAIFRKQIFTDIGPYKKGEVPEDYEFWLRALHAGYRFEKLPDILFDWRESPRRYTRTAPACSREAFDRTRAEYLASDSRLRTERPIVYWGAGRKTRKRAGLLIQKGFPATAWIDIDPGKIGNRIAGVPVHAPQWLKKQHKNKPFVLVYVNNHGARDQIGEWLENHDYHIGTDYLPVG